MFHDLAEHYERLADRYDDTWSHSPDYVAWMNQRVFDRLRIGPGDRVADIGAGTGLFLRSLVKQVTGDNPIVCVDPSAAMLDRLPEDPRLIPVRASAEAVAAGEVELPHRRLDAIVIKETVHHFADVAATLAGLAGQLDSGGRLLVVSLPPRLEYPLFTAALDRFAEHQPEPEDIASAMRAAGLDGAAGPRRVHRARGNGALRGTGGAPVDVGAVHVRRRRARRGAGGDAVPEQAWRARLRRPVRLRARASAVTAQNSVRPMAEAG